MKRATRVFVRRQANWFRQSDPNIHWFQAGDPHVLEDILALLRAHRFDF
jgi:tRNA dimethylallyltransferase